MMENKVSANTIKTLLKTDSQVTVFDCLDSTNSTAKLMAADGAAEGDLIIALSQTGGRGRMGRSFYSPENCGIYFSLILHPKIKTEDISLITPLAAIAVAKAIEKITNKSPKIKWVNDIFLNGKKICGILSESAFDSDGSANYVILGIGINLTPPKKGYPEEIKSIAGSLFSKDDNFDTNLLVAEIINLFFDIYRNLNCLQNKEEYQKRLLLIGKEISYTEGSLQKSGVVMGIDDRFRLIIKNKKGDFAHLQSGEVTIGSKEAFKK